MEDIIVPIAFFAACVCIIYFMMDAKMKRAKMEHEERMLAMEKGILIPTQRKEVTKNPYKWPIILIALGIAWLGAGLIQRDDDFFWALMPLIVGIGLLIVHSRTSKDAKKVPILPDDSIKPE